MILDNNNWLSPVRHVTAKVELFEGSTQVATYTEQDRIKSFDVQRVGIDSKFFGFGICQRLNIHFVDIYRELGVCTDHDMKLYLSCGGDPLNAFPSFKVSEVHRDENTNEASVTAYDKLYAASVHSFAELELTAPYTIYDVAVKVAEVLGLNEVLIYGLPEGYTPFATEYPQGANFEGTEFLRNVLDYIAEATQTIYYLDANENLVFKMPDRDGDPVFTIGKEAYITLSSKTNRRLSDIASVTELGDNVITESGVIGTVVYIKDNPFWDIREDVHILLNNALEPVLSLTVNQFDCTWRGYPSLEIGDKIGIVTKDNEIVYSFVYDDTIEYDGHLKQKTQWQYNDVDNDTLNNSTSLGDALKKTFARVDKVNQRVDIVAGELSTIQLDKESILNRVSQFDEELEEIVADVNSKMTAEDLAIEINKYLQGNEVEKVTTTTGYTFDADGLHINKSGTEIKTSITENGMTIYRGNHEVLVADNLGVKAEDLHATTYLIIGSNSRFENYRGNRTGCFYVGEVDI